jgi:hypothetical protein
MADRADATTPEEYIAALDEPRRGEIQLMHDLVRATLPALEPHIRSGMLGYGEYHYRYDSGREGDWFVVGLASNKRYVSLYVLATDDSGYVAERYADRLPRARIGKSCVRFRRTADLDLDVVRELLAEAGRLSPPGRSGGG